MCGATSGCWLSLDGLDGSSNRTRRVSGLLRSRLRLLFRCGPRSRLRLRCSRLRLGSSLSPVPAPPPSPPPPPGTQQTSTLAPAASCASATLPTSDAAAEDASRPGWPDSSLTSLLCGASVVSHVQQGAPKAMIQVRKSGKLEICESNSHITHECTCSHKHVYRERERERERESTVHRKICAHK